MNHDRNLPGKNTQFNLWHMLIASLGSGAEIRRILA